MVRGTATKAIDTRQTAAAALTGEDAERVRQAIEHAWSGNTRASYRSAWGSFARWCASRGYRPLPCSPEMLARYTANEQAGRGAIARYFEANPHTDTNNTRPPAP